MVFKRLLCISGLGVANFYLINYMNKAAITWINEGNKFLPDTKDEISAHVNSHFSPYVKPHFIPTLTPMISSEHQDWSHLVNQWIEGGKIHTFFAYPSSIFRDNFTMLIDTQPKIMFRSKMSTEEITKTINGQSGITIRSNMEKFIGAHEATHINELHPLITGGVNSTVSALSAYIVLTNIVHAIRHPRLRAAGLALGTMAVYIANHVVSTDIDLHGKEIFVLKINPPYLSILNLLISANLSQVLENRADAGAIKNIIRVHKPQEALEILRAARLLFQLEFFNNQEINSFFRTHPFSFERDKRVQQAIQLLEKQISANLARQTTIDVINTPRIIEINQNESDDPNMESSANETPKTQSGEQVSGVAKNTSTFWSKNNHRSIESHVDTHSASLSCPLEKDNKTMK